MGFRATSSRDVLTPGGGEKLTAITLSLWEISTS